MTALFLLLAALFVAATFLAYYNFIVLKRFREKIRPGDHINIRVETELVNVLVIRHASPGTVLVKQYGRGKVLFYSLKNCYPA